MTIKHLPAKMKIQGFIKYMPKILLKLLIVFLASVQFISCSDITDSDELSSIEVSKIKNIQWNLALIEAPSQQITSDNYEPFKIVIMMNAIWGTDNCNFLRGNCSINNDRLEISDGGITEMGCSVVKTFPFKHLFGSPKIMKRGTNLLIIKNDTTYVYSSNFIGTITKFKFLNDTLILKSSNDIKISFFDSLSIFPKLILTSEREFNIIWYNKPPERTSLINQYSGIFGINENRDILFTEMGGSYSGNGVSIDDWKLVDRIIASNKFEYKNGVLKIINSSAETYYEFHR